MRTNLFRVPGEDKLNPAPEVTDESSQLSAPCVTKWPKTGLRNLLRWWWWPSPVPPVFAPTVSR